MEREREDNAHDCGRKRDAVSLIALTSIFVILIEGSLPSLFNNQIF